MSNLLRAVIVDDEAPARRRLRVLLEEVGGVVVAGECGSGIAAARAMRRGGIDVIFLDVRIPGLSGVEVARVIGVKRPPLVVFVTAYDQYAVDAFGVNAVDYLMKPIGRQGVERALRRVRERLGADTPALRIAARRGDTEVFLAPNGIDWIEAASNYLRLHCGANEWLVRETLDAMETRLATHGFARARRGVLVRIAAIRALEIQVTVGVAVLHDGSRVRVGRRHLARIRRLLRR